jgi:hypothetical protein
VELVERRIVRENVSFSEALRRFLDEADEHEKRRRKKQKPAKRR